MEKKLRVFNYYLNVCIKLVLLLLGTAINLYMYYAVQSLLLKAIAGSIILFYLMPAFIFQLRLLAIIENTKYID